jgi:hypothetical protein
MFTEISYCCFGFYLESSVCEIDTVDLGTLQPGKGQPKVPEHLLLAWKRNHFIHHVVYYQLIRMLKDA